MDRSSGGLGRLYTLAVVVGCLLFAGDLFAGNLASAQSALRGADASARTETELVLDSDFPPAVDGLSPRLFGAQGGESHQGCGACGNDCGGSCGHERTDCWPAGIELTFLRPNYTTNRAFTTQSDGNSDLEFQYDLELSPRLWFGYEMCDGTGWRLTWWQFDHAPDRVFAQPSANNEVTTPPFDGIDISSDDSTEFLLATSNLKAYTFDSELTKRAARGCWRTEATAGVRYAFAEQEYSAQLRNSNSALLSQVDFNHWIRGVGPTLSLAATQFISCETNLFVRGRGSLLFGNHKWHLQGGEELNLTAPVLTNQDGRNGETLSIVEVQAGIGWQAGKQVCRPWRPFATVAFEGQFWSGPGNAARPDGDLGFLGFTLGVGCHW
jgi:hypothetical protein